MRPEPIDPAVKAAIDAAFRADMARFGYRLIDVELGLDHDGDSGIWVDLHYEDSDIPVDPKAMADLVPRISAIVCKLDEDGFPHIRHDFREDRPVLKTLMVSVVAKRRLTRSSGDAGSDVRPR